jgi:hypothetical protein
VIALEVADLVVIASRTLGLDTGQVLELLDTAAAGQALAQAQPASGSRGPATPLPPCCTRWSAGGRCGAATSRSR